MGIEPTPLGVKGRRGNATEMPHLASVFYLLSLCGVFGHFSTIAVGFGFAVVLATYNFLFKD